MAIFFPFVIFRNPPSRPLSESGGAFTALLPNRKKSGEMFLGAWLGWLGWLKMMTLPSGYLTYPLVMADVAIENDRL